MAKKTYDEALSAVIRFVRQNYPMKPYHNKEHGFSVWAAARDLARHACIGYEERVALEAGALLHDVVHDGKGDDEERTALFARVYLPIAGFNDLIAQKASEVILATKMPQRPANDLERMMCDADLSSLGSHNFMVWQDRLRREWGKTEDEAWWNLQYTFLTGHNYHSAVAQKLWGEQKKRNIEAIAQKLASYQERV